MTKNEIPIKSNKDKIFDYFILIVRITLGWLFIYSSLSKIYQPYDFLSSIYDYEIVGPKLGIVIAITLPWIELLAGICLASGILSSGAMLTSAIMGAIFTFVLSSAIYRNLEISCGCFSSNTSLINYVTVIRAAAIFTFSVVAFGRIVIAVLNR